HAVEVDRLAELIENDNADPHAPLDGLFDARLADRFCGRDVDLILLHQDLGGVPANEEFVTIIRTRGARQHKGRCNQQCDIGFHGQDLILMLAMLAWRTGGVSLSCQRTQKGISKILPNGPELLRLFDFVARRYYDECRSRSA